MPKGSAYDERFERLAHAGHDVHGEASFVMGFGPATVLDAGCGTGRVAIELARRGVKVAGIDLDLSMLQAAQRKAPQIEWLQGDVSNFRLADDSGAPRQFDVVLTAGNVMIFLEPGTEGDAVTCLAEHVTPGGLLISGFQLLRGRYGLSAYEAHCQAVGLEPVARYSTWNRDPFDRASGYLVAVHRAPGGEDEAVLDEDTVVASEHVTTTELPPT